MTSDSELFRDIELNCRDFIRLLGDYYDDELPAALKKRLEAHRANCTKCKELDSGYRLTIELAKGLDQHPLPVSIQDRLRQVLNQKLGLSMSSAPRE